MLFLNYESLCHGSMLRCFYFPSSSWGKYNSLESYEEIAIEKAGLS
jgi:hypothetical protein